MGALCEDAMTCAVHAIFDKDEALIEKAEERERQIDQMERDVENLCMRLLLQQQPVARDLRHHFISTENDFGYGAHR